MFGEVSEHIPFGDIKIANLHRKVLWMTISFVWGVIHLTLVRKPDLEGENDWSFGQVVPVVLIAAPLLSVAEYLYPGTPPVFQ